MEVLTVLDPVDGVVVGVLTGDWRKFPVGRRHPSVSHLLVRHPVVLTHGLLLTLLHHGPSVHRIHLPVVLRVLLCGLNNGVMQGIRCCVQVEINNFVSDACLEWILYRKRR